MQFNQMLKNFRISKGVTLRACSAALGVDPSNWSKLERGVNSAPKDQGVLQAWSEYLNINGKDREVFFDAAAISRRGLPTDLDSDVIAALPIFFGAIRGQKLTGAKMAALLNDLRALHSPNKDQ
jgi:transcriptional regulator with XRE-family HTH domain